jgi:hypothetical protein
VPIGQVVKIYIDSPSRPGSGCPPGSGYLEANNKFTVHNVNANNHSGANPVDNFQIHVYGNDRPDGEPAVLFKNQANIKGVIIAPNATVRFLNNAKVTGAIGANKLEFENSVQFTAADTAAGGGTSSAATYSRSVWTECRSQPTDPADPMSGC